MRKARKLAEKAREAGEKARIQSEKARLESNKARWEAGKAKLEAENGKSFSYNFNYTQPSAVKITANTIRYNVDGDKFSASGVSKIDGDVSRIYINGKDAWNENMKVIIDGKEASREELKLLKGDQIESINVKRIRKTGK